MGKCQSHLCLTVLERVRRHLGLKAGLTGVIPCGAEDDNIIKTHKADDTQVPQIVKLFSFSYK